MCISTLVQEGSLLKTVNNPNVPQRGNKQLVKSSFSGISLKKKKKKNVTYNTMDPKKMLTKGQLPEKNRYHTDSICMYVAQK